MTQLAWGAEAKKRAGCKAAVAPEASPEPSAHGTGFTATETTPARVGSAADWQSLIAGAQCSCGLRGTRAYCWGSNAYGQLGDGTKEQHETATAVDTELDFESILAGGNVTCGSRTMRRTVGGRTPLAKSATAPTK